MFLDALANDLLLLPPADTHHLGLAVSNPAVVQDPLTVEVVGGAYRRTQGMVKTGRTWVNGSTLGWFGLAPGTLVAYVMAFDSEVNGRLLYSVRVGPWPFPSGGSYQIATGALSVAP